MIEMVKIKNKIKKVEKRLKLHEVLKTLHGPLTGVERRTD